MGSFLHIALIYQFSIDKNIFEDNELSFEHFEEKMGNKIRLDFSLFERKEEKYKYVWTLKEDVLDKNLFPLLESFYPFAYYESYNHRYRDTLKEVKGKTARQVIEIAENSGSESFQLIYYFEDAYTFFEDNKDDTFPTHVNWSFRPLFLTTEGKISMEEHGATFDLFGRSLQALFSDNPLSKTFVVYIGG